MLALSTTSLILLIIVIVLLFGALPRGPTPHQYGYVPSGFFLLVAVVVVILIVQGHL